MLKALYFNLQTQSNRVLYIYKSHTDTHCLYLVVYIKKNITVLISQFSAYNGTSFVYVLYILVRQYKENLSSHTLLLHRFELTPLTRWT